MESFADVINWLKTDRGLSQSRIAREVHVDRSRVSEWSRGLGYAQPQALERLADKYGLDLELLMRLCGYRVGQPKSESDPGAIAWAALYYQIPPERMPTVTAMVRAAANACGGSAANRPGTRNKDRRRGRDRPPTADKISETSNRWPLVAAFTVALSGLISTLVGHAPSGVAATA